MKVLNLHHQTKVFRCHPLQVARCKNFCEVCPTTIKKLLQLDEEGLEIEDADGNA